jgi:small subunit ribosomal protein S21
MVLRMRVREGEPIGLALRRFKKLCERSGIAHEVRKRKYFIPPTQHRGRKKRRKWFKAHWETILGRKM